MDVAQAPVECELLTSFDECTAPKNPDDGGNVDQCLWVDVHTMSSDCVLSEPMPRCIKAEFFGSGWCSDYEKCTFATPFWREVDGKVELYNNHSCGWLAGDGWKMCRHEQAARVPREALPDVYPPECACLCTRVGVRGPPY